LQQFDIHAAKRPEPLPPEASLSGQEMHIEVYEQQRPGPEQACRVGDERVLKSAEFDIDYRPYPLDPEKTISCDVDHRGKYGE
jgi:hydrogenase maturation protease